MLTDDKLLELFPRDVFANKSLGEIHNYLMSDEVPVWLFFNIPNSGTINAKATYLKELYSKCPAIDKNTKRKFEKLFNLKFDETLYCR